METTINRRDYLNNLALLVSIFKEQGVSNKIKVKQATATKQAQTETITPDLVEELQEKYNELIINSFEHLQVL